MAPVIPQIRVFSPSPIGQAHTTNERVTGPLIVLPGYPPLSTTLTGEQLCNLFPTIHIYILDAHPIVSLLPAHCITHQGLETVVRWHELSQSDPEYEPEANIDVFIEVYQALAFLGNKVHNHTMTCLRDHIADQIEEGLDFADFRAVWELRHLPFTEPFIYLMVLDLAMKVDKLAASCERSGFAHRVDTDEEFRKYFETEFELVNWMKADEKLWHMVNVVRGVEWRKRRRAKRGKKKEMMRRRSAVKCFDTMLRSIEEEKC